MAEFSAAIERICRSASADNPYGTNDDANYSESQYAEERVPHYAAVTLFVSEDCGYPERSNNERQRNGHRACHVADCP